MTLQGYFLFQSWIQGILNFIFIFEFTSNFGSTRVLAFKVEFYFCSINLPTFLALRGVLGLETEFYFHSTNNLKNCSINCIWYTSRGHEAWYFGKINFEAVFRPFRGQLEVRNICGPLVARVMENHFDLKHFSLAITKVQIWHRIF